MINATPQQVAAFVTERLERLRSETGIDLCVSGSDLRQGAEVVVFVRPHDHNMDSERFVPEFAVIEEAAEQEFEGLSVILVPDYACD